MNPSPARRSLKCHNCGAQIAPSELVCPKCGSSANPPPLTTTFSEVDRDTGDARISVDDPLGVRSETHGDTGHVTLNVSGTAGIGWTNEPRVADTLRRAMSSAGLDVAVVAGADDRGEDRLLRVGGREFVLQITTAPNTPNFWRDAHASSATTQVPESHAFMWIRTPIEDKAAVLPPAQRSSTVLAIDATHAGVLGVAQFIQRYMASFVSPSLEFGFASVWVVGPTAEYCSRVGEGYP